MSQKKVQMRKIILAILIVLSGVVAVFVATVLFGKQKLENKMVAGDKAYKIIEYKGEEYRYRDNLINILCLGIDKEESMDMRNDGDGSLGQADAIFLVSLDLEAKEVRVVSVPRDSFVELEQYLEDGTFYDTIHGPIALQYAYADGQERSSELTAKRVSEILCYLPINGYVSINVLSLWKLNDAIGGVDITMDEDYTMFNPLFEKGATVHLYGNALENYIRGRDKMEEGSATTRIHRMKQYMLAFIEKAKNVVKEDMTLPVKLMEQLAPYMCTSLTADEVVYLATEAMECSFLPENMYTLEGETVKTGNYEDYFLDGDSVAQLVIDLFYEPSK